MPRGRGKGGKNRKKGKAQQTKEKRELIFREDGQEYAQVLRLLGGGRVEVQCFDGKKRMGTIRGAMKNRVWINMGDILLISLRDFGDDLKCDIILKYFDEEAKELQELEEIPDHIKIAEGAVDADEDGFGLGDGDDDEDGDEEEKKEIDIDKI